MSKGGFGGFGSFRPVGREGAAGHGGKWSGLQEADRPCPASELGGGRREPAWKGASARSVNINTVS